MQKKSRDDFLKAISSNLHQMREDLGISLNELSSVVGIHPNTLMNYEWGKTMPSAYNLYLIANYYGCDYEELLD